MSKNKIAIIDYGMGNLHSVASALQQVSTEAEINIVNDAKALADADRVVFPGVGAMRDCIAEIKRLGFDSAVAEALSASKPVLAICVGMQSLLSSSEENEGVECLDVLPGKVKLFEADSASEEPLKVPHMGWNQVVQKVRHPLWKDIPQASRFYFVHSYYVALDAPSLLAGETDYGQPFTAAIAKDSLFAVQFHPEKSHTHGLQLLKNFVSWDGKAQ